MVQLAQESGATIDIGYQNLSNLVTRKPPFLAADMMSRFADALADLVNNHGLTNVRWAEVANEPNSGAVTLDQYKTLCQDLKDELVARGLGDQIQIMGGGLVENAGNPARDHYSWMSWIAANMGNLVGGYAEHVYWQYNDSGRLEYRLRDTYHLMTSVLPADQQKPVYMMEYGIRGDANCGTKPTFTNLYYGADPTNCPEIWRTNIAGFQQLWFDIDAAQLGVAGTSKWDAYWAVYDRNSVKQQVYWMIGPASENYPLTPTYNAMSLLFHSTAPGWQIIQVEPWQDDDWKLPDAEYRREGHRASRPARAGARRLRRPERRADGRRARHARQEPERRLDGSRRRRTASAGCRRTRRSRSRSGTRPATARTRSPGRSPRTRRASPGSRCRSRRPSR